MSDATVPETITLKLPSRLELLAVLDRVALTVCERMEFDEDTSSQVSMSVIEAGTNAVQHGHKRDAAKFFEVEFRLLPDRLEVDVRDSGKGFDVKKLVPDVTVPEHLLDMRGRGIFIMKSCMDEVDFEFGKHGTVCHLVKHRAAARRAADAKARGFLPRILAVDWGERRIGLAVSDDLGILATGLPTLEIRGEAEAVARVADTIRTVEADSVVVGLPLTLKGERGEAARAVERFAEALRRETPVVVSLYDERLTSALAARRMHERGESARGRKGRMDQGAAVVLLEGWLARLRIEREGDAT